jgi:hypothetical protein
MTVILGFINARIDHLKKTTPIHICVGSSCHDLETAQTTSVHNAPSIVSIECNFENETIPKELERLNKLVRIKFQSHNIGFPTEKNDFVFNEHTIYFTHILSI